MQMSTSMTVGVALATALLAIACGPRDQTSADTATLTATAASPDGPHGADTTRHAGGMQGMKDGESGRGSTRHMSAALMDSMERRLESLEGVSAVQMATIVPAHSQLVARLLAELDSDMRAMKMTPDAAWRALTDSVRRDLTRMPKMEGSELRVFMPDHHRRVDHLVTTHRKLMNGSKM
jgi:hypothetical protein